MGFQGFRIPRCFKPEGYVELHEQSYIILLMRRKRKAMEQIHCSSTVERSHRVEIRIKRCYLDQEDRN